MTTALGVLGIVALSLYVIDKGCEFYLAFAPVVRALRDRRRRD